MATLTGEWQKGDGCSGAFFPLLDSRLTEVVEASWTEVQDPMTDKWKTDFSLFVTGKKTTWPGGIFERGAMNSFHHNTAPSPSCPMNLDRAASEQSDIKPSLAALDALSCEAKFDVIVGLRRTLEGPWLVGCKRRAGIKAEEEARPLKLSDVIDYSRRLSGSVSAPPETQNLSDPSLHQTLYPYSHFLPYPSVEEMQMSQMCNLATKPYHTVCFPPEFKFDTLESSGVPRSRLTITASTPGASIFYRIDPKQADIRYDPNRRPIIVGPHNVRIRAYATKPGLRNSRLSQIVYKFDSSKVRLEIVTPDTLTEGAPEPRPVAVPQTRQPNPPSQQFGGLLLGRSARQKRNRKEDESPSSSSRSEGSSSSDGESQQSSINGSDRE